MIEQTHDDGFDKSLVNFTFEMSQLRQESRHGWHRILENPESVAEHIQRAAALGYLLAVREGFEDPNLIVTMILFHDMHEARCGDKDKLQRLYVTIDEERAAVDQVKDLGKAGEGILQMWREVEHGSTQAGVIAKDAEILEMVFTARELVVHGNLDAQAWIDDTRGRMMTRSGREILEMVNVADPHDWWKSIFR
ncbi:MAG: HD domain-containing protein [Bdellovibrionales bacterium]|nr:HD domain-containing protein [Bdellovibrionales bacterium]